MVFLEKIWNNFNLSILVEFWKLFSISNFHISRFRNDQQREISIHELFKFKRRENSVFFFFNFKLEIYENTLLTLQFHFIPIVSFIVPII